MAATIIELGSFSGPAYSFATRKIFAVGAVAVLTALRGMYRAMKRSTKAALPRKPRKSGLTLYTACTMNGYKTTIALEELGIGYNVVYIDFGKKQQKEPWYLEINPNGRIPAIVDHDNGDFKLAESGAILVYLSERCGGKLWPTTRKERHEAMQWLMFQMSGVGPMMGQAMYFQRIALPKGNHQPFAIKRYVTESNRLIQVIEKRLSDGRPYIMGDMFTMVDIANWAYVATAFWANINLAKFPYYVMPGLKCVKGRPAVEKGITIPDKRPEFFGEGNIREAVQKNAASFELPK